MEAARRQFLTGLAAVAVAGVIPALPAPPVPLARYGRAFALRDSDSYLFGHSARNIFWNSRWHIHIHSPTEQTYHHVDSGQTFATDPGEPEHIWFAGCNGDREISRPVLAYAAIYCQPRACGVYDRRLLAGHSEGAFFLYCSDDIPIPRFISEDAPALPRLA